MRELSILVLLIAETRYSVRKPYGKPRFQARDLDVGLASFPADRALPDKLTKGQILARNRSPSGTGRFWLQFLIWLAGFSRLETAPKPPNCLQGASKTS